MNQTKNTILTAAMLALSCGFAVDAMAQTKTDRQNEKMQDQTDQRSKNSKFYDQKSTSRALGYFKKIKGMNVKNSADDKVTEIKDVLFDRYSGDIAAYIVSDDRVLMPSELQTNVDADGKLSFRTATTSEALGASMKFDSAMLKADRAKSKDGVSWWNRFSSESGKHVSTTEPQYVPEKVRSMDAIDINGTVISTHRIRGEGEVYRTLIEVRSDDGTNRTVILGPTWYLADHQVLPVRGDKVVIKAVPIETIDGADFAASKVRVSNRDEVVLRKGNEFAPTWYSEGKADNAMAMQRRLLLASEVIGDDVKCREELSGEVENLVIDFRNGRVAALVIDPNQAFLGMGDTTRMIPLSVASASTDDLIYIDATKDMIVKAPAAPDKLETMNSSWDLDSIYDQRPIASVIR